MMWWFGGTWIWIGMRCVIRNTDTDNQGVTRSYCSCFTIFPTACNIDSRYVNSISSVFFSLSFGFFIMQFENNFCIICKRDCDPCVSALLTCSLTNCGTSLWLSSLLGYHFVFFLLLYCCVKVNCWCRYWCTWNCDSMVFAATVRFCWAASRIDDRRPSDFRAFSSRNP
jgi:hypothetical protein